MLAERIHRHRADAWLLNTGWCGGSFGTGSRIALKYTRAILDAIHSGELAKAEYEAFGVFNLHIPKACSGVPTELLHPERGWQDQAAFQETVIKLAQLFAENFENYTDKAGPNVLAAGPTILLDDEPPQEY
jgi:phosphoenolpyruvate carboxykinase (ATP)